MFEDCMKGAGKKRTLSAKDLEGLLRVLKTRFEKNMNRHKSLDWAEVQTRLEGNSGKLWSLNEMEKTGGEPDVVSYDQRTGSYTFVDCSPQSPDGRVSLCYDREGWESRKEHRPKDTAVDMADALGVELLTEEQYLELQKLGEFDTRTSSWIRTPPAIRKLGGALYGCHSYGRVFVGANGAQSYFRGRGFRACLKA